jgi:hypothetical protein
MHVNLFHLISLRYQRLRVVWRRVCRRPDAFYARLGESDLRRRMGSVLRVALFFFFGWAACATLPANWAWRTTLDLVSSDRLVAMVPHPYLVVSDLWGALCLFLCVLVVVQSLRGGAYRVKPGHDVVAMAEGFGVCSVHLGRASAGKTMGDLHAELSALLRELAAAGVERVVLHSPLFGGGSRWVSGRLPRVLAVAGLAHVQVDHEAGAPLAPHTSWTYWALHHLPLPAAKRADRALRWSRCCIIAPRVTLSLQD